MTVLIAPMMVSTKTKTAKILDCVQLADLYISNGNGIKIVSTKDTGQPCAAEADKYKPDDKNLDSYDTLPDE
ncbi:hypothetical protein PInf_018979 [Phytophthora infestans]|nr:hypothetical protein PInf_018979 [Phytophthora infestans]